MKCRDKFLFRTVAETMFELEKGTYANSTIKAWRSKLKRIVTFFGELDIRDIVRSCILRYLHAHNDLTNKTLNEDLTLIRKVFTFAVGDRLITQSPVDGIHNLQNAPISCNPFTLNDITRLTHQAAACSSIKNGVLLACHTGLRKSEWLALVVDDYDPVKRELKVERACVVNHFKRPKTTGSKRRIQLSKTAQKIIENQLSLIFGLAAQEIHITENDQKTRTKLTAKPLFPNLDTGKFYQKDKAIDRTFKNWLVTANVAHRGASQARHTFASQAILSGANLYWIRSQLGHNTLDMLYKHYSKWIEEDAKDYPNLIDLHFQKAANSVDKPIL